MSPAKIILIIFLLSAASLHGQVHSDSVSKKDQLITISGTVVEKSTSSPVFNTIIIQKGVGGKFLNPDGAFSIKIRRTDTLLISATGYGIEKFCFKDSAGTNFKLDVKIEKLHFELAEHVVMPKRTISEIHDDLEGVRLVLPDRPTKADALSSPITAIYAAFSRTERSKRLVAEMEHKDRKEELLIELFKIYVDADIINLSPDEFQYFIYYSNVSDEFLRTASELDLITFFQQRYEEYIALRK